MKTSRSIAAVCVPCLSLLLGLSIASNASAAILASDSFDYPAGALAGNNGGAGWGNPWLGPSAASTAADILDDAGNSKLAVTLSGTTTASAATRQLAAPIAQTFYAGFSLRYTGTEFGGNNTFGLLLTGEPAPSPGSVPANILNFNMRDSTTTTQPSYTNNFCVRGGTGNLSSENQATGGLVTPGADYLLVAKMTYAGGTFDTIELWLNASGPSEPAAHASYSLAAGTGLSQVANLMFRQAANQTADSWLVDNLVIATTWEETIAFVPEPSTLALAMLGGFALLLRSKRRK